MSLEITDQLQRTIRFENTPKRIVSLVPSQTELLCDLGLEDNLVGVTKFCVHPNHIKSTSKVVGGTKRIHIKKITALQPDIILCNKEENTKAIVEACATIAPIHISDICTLNDSLILIKQYGKIFEKQGTATKLIETIKREADIFQNYIKNKRSYKTAYFIWMLPWMMAGKNTFIDFLLHLNRFENITHKARYPEVNLNVNKEVELVLLSSEPFPFKEKHKKELQKFYPKAKVLLVDGEMFSWYGSRLTKAFAYFRLLHEHL
ncbi:ABC transporter substrate-binding protein [Hyunsoonleella pacifica]|uniref:Cobalamin-binding protein n=1 Tax=Hyunsoonleella pacifica TaxID=1080224 RepID=A0A4Q9FSV3_9FLAO|nr:helical backbone metal receptor [Hyunsoonleella pacifica]TBN19057.1 cobalamin-binding protein [Hyunsoonleella pacifica]GGD06974.1 iron ABC transporter [Hyunsoonleella pacifica]